MRRFLWLALGVILMTYGFGVVAGGDTWAAYRLRDGLLVALVGALIFGRQSGRLVLLPTVGGARNWPLWGRIWTVTGFACGLAAALVLTWGGTQGPLALFGGSLWGVGLVALGVGLLWPGTVEIYPAPTFRWRVDAAGRWVRYVLGENVAREHAEGATAELSAPPIYRLLWVGVLLLGVALRFWRLTTLPPACVDAECTRALQLAEGAWAGGLGSAAGSLYWGLAALLQRSGWESVAALRGAGALLGSLTLPLVYWAARAYARRPAALVALGVVALLPWMLWSSRVGSPWSAAPLLLLWTLGAAGRATARPSRQRWGMAGIGLGLLLAQPLPLHLPTLVWLVGLAWVAWRTSHPGRRSSEQVAVVVGSTLTVGLAWLLPVWQASLAPAPLDDTAQIALAGLLYGGETGLTYFLTHPLLPAWTAALALAGWAALVHGLRQPRALLVAVGALIYGVAVPLGGAEGTAAELWLPLSAFVWVCLAIAADQLLLSFNGAWARLLPLPRVVTAVVLLLLLLVGRESWAMRAGLGRAGGGSQNAVEIAMGQYLARCLRGEGVDDPCTLQGEGAPRFYAPAAVLNHPATRLLLGNAAGADRVQLFDPSVDLLPTTTPTGDLFYLIALDNQSVIELLQQLYPTAQLRAEPQDQAGPTLFVVVRIPQADALARQGLHGRLYAGDALQGEPLALRQDGPLQFAWTNEPPMSSPFSGIWEGSLLVPAAGNYTFAVETAATGPGAPTISLQLDGALLLDTSLGLLERREALAQGAYQLTLRYFAPGPPADWAITWTSADIGAAPIARTSLYSPPLPDIGLLATYYAGSNWDGPVLAVRKELVLGAPVTLPTPYSVVWQGQLAAPRAGETFFAITANGPAILTVDGRETLLHLPPTDLATGPGYSQAGIYLTQGRHSFELRYAPAERSDLRMLWQPPGSGPRLLLGRDLLPRITPVSAQDIPLPAPPELIDARLGDDNFALSANVETGPGAPPLRSLLPLDLPPLLAEQVWRVGAGCGAGTDQFATPRGLALDVAAGRLYVADADNRRVVELALTDGAELRTYALDAFVEPVDVALEPQGTLLVLDAGVPAIFRLDRQTGEAAPLALGTGFYKPRGLGVDLWGNIAVADTGGARVALLDPTGALLAQFGGGGTRLGVGQPVDAVAVNGQWWAISAEDGRLWQLETLGSLAVVERANTLNGPQLAALEDGSGLFITDPTRRTLTFLTPNGEPQGQVAYPDAFAAPMGVAAARTDTGLVQLVVSDSAACAVSLWQARLP